MKKFIGKLWYFLTNYKDVDRKFYRRHLGTLLMIIGIVIIAVPLIGRYLTYQKQNELVSDFYLQNAVGTDATTDYSQLDEVFSATDTESAQQALEASAQGVENTQINQEVQTLDESVALKAKPKAIAIVKIPKLDLTLPVAEGTSASTLQFAIGHMPETADLGTIGNAAIAGHRSHSYGVFFNRLDELGNGDEVIVETADGTTTYVVYESKIVKPEDTSVLKGSSKYKVLTLITCDPMINPVNRLIVHAIAK